MVDALGAMGLKCIEAAIEHRPDVPIIRCSGNNAPSALRSPRIHVFPKPCSVGELSKFVASLVGKA